MMWKSLYKIAGCGRLIGLMVILAAGMPANRGIAQQQDRDAETDGRAVILDTSEEFTDLADDLADDLLADADQAGTSSDCYCRCQSWYCPQAHAPNMIGDFFNGYTSGVRGNFQIS